MSKIKVLIIEDEAGIRFGIRKFLTSKGYEVIEADTCAKGKESFQTAKPDIAVIDYSLPDGNALDLLPQLKNIDNSIPLVILTAHGSIELAVRAIKEGAEQFLTKPIELPALQVILARLLENQRNRQKNLALESQLSRTSINPFIGDSPAIHQLFDRVKRVLAADSPILIQGETGSGKGVLARWLHDHSPRAQEPFVDLNCAGLTKEFLETELFGHEKGAFTSAINSKPGLFEVAHHGTMFLDEIGDIDSQIQPKLLKVLEEQRFRRLGSISDRQVDVRLIAATHQDLRRQIEEKRFRSDLFFRINTIPIMVPPLRERVTDIPVLANMFLKSFTSSLKRELTLSLDAERALQAYAWPGNIRELRNILERAVLLSDSTTLTSRDLPFDNLSLLPMAKLAEDYNYSLAENERRHIDRVLQAEGSVTKAAKILGLSRNSLYLKVKKYGITLVH